MRGSFPVRLAATIYFIVMLCALWIVAWLAQVVVIISTYFFWTREERADCCGRIFRFSNYMAGDLLNPLWNTTILRPFPDVRGKKVIVMMNHASGADPFLMVRVLLPHDASWVAKDDLFRVPFGGWAMANADDLCVCFKDKKLGLETVKGSVGPMMEAARQKVRRGRMLAVFPEGTRNNTPSKGLQPFRPGFFKLAMEEDATIVPVAITGSESCWPRHSPLIDAGHVFVSCGDPVDAASFQTLDELREHVWNMLTDLCSKHPTEETKGLKGN
uniref:Uncharacterized protein TCIL3000_11_15320 n=1 Tax=Trypanosoma congolense (strain IL3000) TaxID=1068625 RepID=G0V2Z2_TRYCI|nr:unnamed protein product [Trypanosoma congolense IL3000]